MSALPTTLLRSANGATAEVAHHGAHVVSWRPVPGDIERLFLSERSEMRDGVAIRGGIPVIFPQFAAEGPLPRHGFARTTSWTPGTAGPAADGDAVATFHLADSAETRAIWPAAFRATIEVRVGGDRLIVTLSVENTGEHDMQFTAALHAYLRVLDVRHARLVGLRGARYREGDAPLVADRADALRVTGEIDRVYVNAPRHVTLFEPVRALRIETNGFPDVVVWNPGPDRAATLADMAPGDERHMLCVEAAAVHEPIVSAPGRVWSASQTLTAIAGDGSMIPHSARAR